MLKKISMTLRHLICSFLFLFDEYVFSIFILFLSHYPQKKKLIYGLALLFIENVKLVMLKDNPFFLVTFFSTGILRQEVILVSVLAA